MRFSRLSSAMLAGVALLGFVGPSFAQSTQLGPFMTNASVGGTAQMAVVGANPTRRSLQVCNNHASQTLTLTFGTVTPVSGTTGLVIAAGTCFTTPAAITSGVGAQVNLIASGSSTPATILEY